MKQSAEVSNQLTSVDRLLKYSTLPEEQQPDSKLIKIFLRFLKILKKHSKWVLFPYLYYL